MSAPVSTFADPEARAIVIDRVAEAIHSAIFEEALGKPGTIERALYRQAAEAALKAGVEAWAGLTLPPARATPTGLHAYKAHPKWPWFCGECGYPEHERMKHVAIDLSDVVGGVK